MDELPVGNDIESGLEVNRCGEAEPSPCIALSIGNSPNSVELSLNKIYYSPYRRKGKGDFPGLNDLSVVEPVLDLLF